MKTEFLRPKPGGVVRHPNGEPVAESGEELPLNGHFLYYIKQGSLISGDTKRADLVSKLEAAEEKHANAAVILEGLANAADPDPEKIEDQEKVVAAAASAVEKADKSLSNYDAKNATS